MRMTYTLRSELTKEEVEFLRERDRGYHIIRKDKQSYKDYQQMSAIRDKEKRKVQQKNSAFKYKYGITTEDYKRMFEEQNRCCKICMRHQDELTKKLDVDHCHRNPDNIRGLLCGSCNRGLGLFKDDASLLERAKEYVSLS